MASAAETSLNQSAALAPRPARPIPDIESRSLVDISPPEIVRRHSKAWSGLYVETVRVPRHTPFEYGFPPPCHLLIAGELADPSDATTFVHALPLSPFP